MDHLIQTDVSQIPVPGTAPIKREVNKQDVFKKKTLATLQIDKWATQEEFEADEKPYQTSCAADLLDFDARQKLTEMLEHARQVEAHIGLVAILIRRFDEPHYYRGITSIKTPMPHDPIIASVQTDSIDVALDWLEQQIKENTN